MNKTWLESLTIRGLLVILFGVLVEHFGVQANPEVLADQVVELVALAIQFLGVAMAAFGRKRAEGPLA